MIELILPNLRPYFEEVLELELGIMKGSIKIDSVESGMINENLERNCNDRATLRIPHGSQYLRWQVLFDGHDLTEAPDFMDDDNFFTSLNLGLLREFVPTLGAWDPNRADGLAQVIREFLALYQNRQVHMLKSNENLQRYEFEYEMLTSLGVVQPDELEVNVRHSPRGTSVEFCIAIKLDIKGTPLVEPDPPRSLAVLIVSYHTEEETRIEIPLWQELESFIGGISIPPINADSALMDYVPDIRNYIQGKIARAIANRNHRKNLFCALVKCIEPAMLDADCENFTKISFILEDDSQQVICNITIPETFPDERPSILLYKAGDTEPVVIAPEERSYSSPRCSDKIASTLFQHILRIFEEWETYTNV